jgi:GH24 family phage-related lysozyme (muramidase)
MNKILLLCLISFVFSGRTVSQNGIKLIKEFEGCRLKAYQDAVGVWTIGYGTTNADKSITGTTIKSGLTISQATADSWLKKSLDKKYGPKVNKYDSKYKWTQNEFDALISFAYNIGSIDQLTANGSRSRATIANKMLEYVNANHQRLPGLVRRRQAEHDLFVKH